MDSFMIIVWAGNHSQMSADGRKRFGETGCREDEKAEYYFNILIKSSLNNIYRLKQYFVASQIVL